MASPIYCDVQGCDTLADQIMTNTSTGDVLAFCNEHFVGFCIQMAANAQAEVDLEANGPAPDPEALATTDTEPAEAELEPKSDETEAETDDQEGAQEQEPAGVAADD